MSEYHMESVAVLVLKRSSILSSSYLFLGAAWQTLGTNGNILGDTGFHIQEHLHGGASKPMRTYSATRTC